MVTTTDLDVKRAIVKILADEKSYPKSLNYAVDYCLAAMSMAGDDLRVQVLYILNNISHWRHADAKEVRLVLKNYCGIKK